MLYKNFLATTVLAAGLAFSTPVFADANIGAPAPAFSGTDSKGHAVSLGDFKGKTVVLEWTNHRCPFVQKHYDTGNMQALQKDATEDGVVWLSVLSSAADSSSYVSGAEADKLTEKRDAHPSAVILDPEGEIGRLYEATATPHMYVIDGDGTLVYKGAIDDTPTADKADVETAENYVRLALDALAAGEPIAQSSTRVYGCAIKYAS